MSEYIEIDPQPTSDPHKMILHTNLNLTPQTQTPETYTSTTAMEEGSPLAQTLAYVEGIRCLHVEGQTLTVVRDPDVDWHVIIADISAAVRDFFL